MTIPRFLGVAPLCACVLMVACTSAPTPTATPTASQVFDKTLTNTEKEFVSLVDAMPADKFNFAPTGGKFEGVRTFGQQAMHVAFVLNKLSAPLLGEAAPADTKGENGPETIEGKDQILPYVKEAFAHARKAVATLTNSNLMEETVNPFDPKAKQSRVETAGEMSSHTFDHYGQMVEYARMNGIVPPASQ